MKSKWEELLGEGYVLEDLVEDLGRPAEFLLPTKKLPTKLEDGMTVEESLHAFIISNFSAYTTSLIPSFGFWRDVEKTAVTDECRKYEVSFLGKEKIPILLQKLAELAEAMGENCIYVKAGQYSCLLYPKTVLCKKDSAD